MSVPYCQANIDCINTWRRNHSGVYADEHLELSAAFMAAASAFRTSESEEAWADYVAAAGALQEADPTGAPPLVWSVQPEDE